MKTKQLYYDDIDLLEFEANIIEINEVKGEYHLILDQTAFYPEGGGMNCDIGFIDDIEVIRVNKKDDEIIHILKDKPKQMKVVGKVDSYNRFTNIQIHDAQHLLTAIFEKDYDLKTVSHHVHGTYCDLVLEGEELTNEIMYDVERLSNQLIIENRRLDTTLVAKKDLAKLGVEDNPKYTDPVRMTNIEGLDDYNACGCLHFTSLAPIQAVKCLSIEKTGKQHKILFTAGLRMIEFFDEYNNIVKELKLLTKGNEQTIVTKTAESLEKNIVLSKELNEAKEDLYSEKLDKLIVDNKIIFEANEDSFDDLKILANSVVNYDKEIYGLLQTKKDDKYQFILVKQKNSDYSLSDLLNKLKDDFNVRGGGKGSSINGQSDVDLIKEIDKYL
ncbi:alanyl-tRNA synthetase [Bacilli bacterium PM5-3]|nr:alanyl-tRNA synthetase [Bacilli bacterium PM5-3]